MMELADRDFRHPYVPYEIQLQFMKSLYSCLEAGNIGIFESPTDDNEPDWMVQHARRERRQNAVAVRKEFEDRLAQIRENERQQRKKAADQNFHRHKKPRLDGSTAHQSDTSSREEEFQLDDYESGDEHQPSKDVMSGPDLLSTETLSLLEKLNGSATSHLDPDVDDETRIIYCSRTHSQLIQFAHEMRRVKPLPSIPPDFDLDFQPKTQAEKSQMDEQEDDIAEEIKHIPLGSRKTLCINPKVQSLGSSTAISERCLELQRPGVDSEHKCPYIPPKDNDASTHDFRDHALANIPDIEDLGKIGKKMGICPYYASRTAMKHSEIITLPYPLLLQRSAREALNMSVKNHIIIIDEAHNLMDAISNIHSASISLSQLRLAIDQLTTYARKFKTRLKGKNRVYVAQTIRLLSSIATSLESIQTNKLRADGALKASDIMSGKAIDQINPHKLLRYLQESKLARKVDGYIDHVKMSSNGEAKFTKATVPVIFHAQSFLLTLMDPSEEGQLFYEKAGNDVQLKYLLLDPTSRFREIVEDARAVILAGGTMSPMEDYVNHLLSYVPRDKVKTFSYGHVIPQNNLIALNLGVGILNAEFDFTFEKRNSETLITSLGKTIAQACTVIPDGVVVFFPSYEYLTHVLKIWGRSPASKTSSLLESLERLKPVFYEAQEATGNSSETLLPQYSDSIDAGKGGLLLAVMGGKLSEGINFSDRLGRGVIVVGLPFANAHTAVWQAKLNHIERKTYDMCSGSDGARKAQAKMASRSFYENSCMRTVNQCIGRAIRHQNDYAAILLLDKRYGTTRIQNKLPSWIRRSFSSPLIHTPGEVVSALTKFFSQKSK
ncbi:ATP-dependent DNA helicase chl1 [Myotisia sp. PD_48]|nr:ATP-dependent DNA helicase chl1 [Myotisia sp. PD_48]